jgi:hypothetical protein
MRDAQQHAVQSPLPTVRRPWATAEIRPRKPRCAVFEGYSLHADLAVGHKETKKLERLLRYRLRPPFAQKRLSLTSDGKVRLKLRKPYTTGQTEIVLPPKDSLRRLIATIPPSGMNMSSLSRGFRPPRDGSASAAGPVASQRPGQAQQRDHRAVHQLGHHRHRPVPRRAERRPSAGAPALQTTLARAAQESLRPRSRLRTLRLQDAPHQPHRGSPDHRARSSVTSVCRPSRPEKPQPALPRSVSSTSATSTSPSSTTFPSSTSTDRHTQPPRFDSQSVPDTRAPPPG